MNSEPYTHLNRHGISPFLPIPRFSDAAAIKLNVLAFISVEFEQLEVGALDLYSVTRIWLENNPDNFRTGTES